MAMLVTAKKLEDRNVLTGQNMLNFVEEHIFIINKTYKIAHTNGEGQSKACIHIIANCQA